MLPRTGLKVLFDDLFYGPAILKRRKKWLSLLTKVHVYFRCLSQRSRPQDTWPHRRREGSFCGFWRNHHNPTTNKNINNSYQRWLTCMPVIFLIVSFCGSTILKWRNKCLLFLTKVRLYFRCRSQRSRRLNTLQHRRREGSFYGFWRNHHNPIIDEKHI